MLWGFLNITVENFKSLIILLCILLFCDEMLWGFQKHYWNIWKSSILMYCIIFCWNTLMICKKNQCWNSNNNNKLKKKSSFFDKILWWFFFKNHCWKFWKMEFFCILLLCDEMLWGFPKKNQHNKTTATTTTNQKKKKRKNDDDDDYHFISFACSKRRHLTPDLNTALVHVAQYMSSDWIIIIVCIYMINRAHYC